MPAAPFPPDELSRLESLRRMEVLDTPAEARFDRLTRLARRLFNVPFSMVTLLDTDRQWFKAAAGHCIPETPRSLSLCGYTLLENRPLTISDTRADPRTCDNPVVTGEMNVQFYSGVPLRNHDGHCVGTFCILDVQQRQLTPEDHHALKDLAACAESELRLQRLTQTERQLLQEMDALRRRTTIDPVSRCWNEATIQELLEKELAGATAGNLTVIALGVDDFLSLAQLDGKPHGDLVLRETADRLRAGLMAHQMLGRSGPVDFLLVLPGVRASAAPELAHSMLGRLRDRHYRFGNNLVPVTGSLGVAVWRGRQESAESLIERAHRSLGRAQSGEGNQVQVAL